MTLDEFAKRLKRQGDVEPQKISFFIGWVKQYLQFCNVQSGSAASDEQLPLFLEMLSKRCEQWQVDQAKEAVARYCCYLNRTHRDPLSRDVGWQQSWADAG